MKILYISMHPAPYRDSILAYMKQKYRKDFDILTLYPQQTTHKEWMLKEKTYDDIIPNKIISFGKLDIHLGVIKQIRENNYDAVFIQGYMPPISLVSYCYCKLKNIKIVYCADTTFEYYGAKKCRKINFLLAKKSDALYVPGSAAKRFWLSKGIRSEKIFEGMYSLDASKLISEKRGLYNAFFEKLKGKFIYLFIGNFIKERNVPDLVEGFIKIANEDDVLILIGKGEQEHEIKKLIKGKNNIFVFPGIPFDQIHEFYERANVYVHPGKEPYSVAVQEAALKGLKIISTTEVGATLDFVKGRENGILISNNDLLGLEKALREIKNYKIDMKTIEKLKRERGIGFAKNEMDRLYRWLEKV